MVMMGDERTYGGSGRRAEGQREYDEEKGSSFGEMHPSKKEDGGTATLRCVQEKKVDRLG